MELIKSMMRDAGLEWNDKKCRCAHLKRGKYYFEDIELSDDFQLKCLDSIDSYKFLGVPECVEHNIDILCTQLLETIRKKAHIV